MLLPARPSPTSLAQEACAPTRPTTSEVGKEASPNPLPWRGLLTPLSTGEVGVRPQGNVRSTSLPVTERVKLTPLVAGWEGASAFFAQRA
jgi:hypothetical protein